jgi:hypothetical protein
LKNNFIQILNKNLMKKSILIILCSLLVNICTYAKIDNSSKSNSGSYYNDVSYLKTYSIVSKVLLVNDIQKQASETTNVQFSHGWNCATATGDAEMGGAILTVTVTFCSLAPSSVNENAAAGLLDKLIQKIEK